ncbi:hypothetical protein CHLRE_04g213150v5 [Chlamydomonas reinhardtii]|uniref:Protein DETOXIFICATION n=1 Tax=Chlamydomonas reinhardtii TaxID=3055 RepID=A0A2K3DTW1_CHLRE|nr:uncharacterized protein CHLRE_04g213150v5 [Chlamydomonas reinhardtii]PNW83980.1 hypothetical protein CHLRE_04g213150v5 [Chlamydomonas reinhardtii]
MGALNPPEAAVAAYAIDYIKVRSLGIPAALLGFVATGVFRGFKDTRTPLFGAVASGLASLGLNVLFLYVLNMGVVGSAFATMAAQLISCGLLMAALLAGGKVRPGHLTRPPPLSSVLPTLKLGAVLGARNVISFGMVLYASTMCIRLGSAYQASFEVIRQVWILTIQFFECLNVAAQALCASYIGNDDAATARSVLGRLVVLGTGVGVGVGLGVWAAHGPLIAFFTKDPVVVAHVMATLPLICLCFPIDAAASIMDGSLLAAKQSNYMSAVQIVGSVVQYGVLSYLAGTAGAVSTFSVWGALKILSFARLIGGVSRNYFSPKSAYVMKSWGAAAGAAVAGAAGAAVAGGAQLGASEAGPALERERELAGASVSGSGIASSSSSAFTSFASGSSSISSGGSGSSNVVPVALQSLEEDVMVLAAAACSSATDMHPDMIEMHRRSSSGSSSSSCSQPAAAVAAVALGNGDGHLNGNGGSSSNGAGGMGHGRGGAEVGPEPAAAVVAGGGRTAAPPSAPAADATERA